MFGFIKKSHESKEEHPPSYFYNKHREHNKYLSNPKNAYISKIKNKNFYETNKIRTQDDMCT